MCVLIFSTNLSEVFLNLRRNQGNIATNLSRTSRTVHYSGQTLIVLVFPQQIFEKSTNIKFHGNTFGGR